MALGAPGIHSLFLLLLSPFIQLFQQVFERGAFLDDGLQLGNYFLQFALFHHAVGERVGNAFRVLERERPP